MIEHGFANQIPDQNLVGKKHGGQMSMFYEAREMVHKSFP